MGRWIFLLPFCLFLRDQPPVPRSTSLVLGEETAAKLGDPKDDMERLRQTDPLAFLEKCLLRYKSEVKAYTCNFRKWEKVRGKQMDPEEIGVAFREEPFSVYMNWLAGARLTAAKKVLYVEGENGGNLLALPTIPFLPIQTRDIHGADAKAGSRYTVDQMGMFLGMDRTVKNMRKAKERGALHLKYLGEVNESRLGDITCYKFLRKPYDPPEEDGIYELVLFVDKETWLQVGSILLDAKGEMIAEYFFRDVKLNPTFPNWKFTKSALEK